MIDKDKREKFDIERFEKNKDENNEYYFVDEEGYTVFQDGLKKFYYEQRRKLDELFEEFYQFYLDGNIAEKGMRYYNLFISGIWYEYDRKGNLIKETDYDAPYKNYPWERFKALLEDKYKLNLFDSRVRISRYILPKNSPTWRAVFNLPNHSPLITVDVATGDEHYYVMESIE